MKVRRWLGDTMARRFGLTILLAIAATLLMNGLFVALAGVWGRPSFEKSGLLDAAAATVRITEAQPPGIRAALASSAGTGAYSVIWSVEPPVDPSEHLQTVYMRGVTAFRRVLDDPSRTIIFFNSDMPEVRSSERMQDLLRNGLRFFTSVRLTDGTWLTFTASQRSWGISMPLRYILIGLFAGLSTIIFATAAACATAAPVERLAAGVRRFGANPRAPALPLQGPAELRETISAFNNMQAQIRRFVEDRTMMLAAISHDLRTPLTRMRLRGEFIDDPVQQRKLFQDVEEMQSMVDSALAFFRDDAGHEQATSFDLAELLKTIIDNYGDQGIEIAYSGPDHARWSGRPQALRRVFVNLLENAIKHAALPSITLRVTQRGAEVTVRDRGPGIDDDKLDQVFLPFRRLSKARQPSTGGMGLGLTSARSIVRAHGGDITLQNHASGGLQAVIVLPPSAA
ncbi:sensor histidine kinase [Muricoccus pecuniae]|uniref:histidine kinase n=1 Tax=Muricoccus pecuniae TaxID=693023 RepID=A0A840Y921_9PROT|nr:HAMP domain-containing sensor histidine kinase [Roseomonas pecuniae]MBB5696430.1 signal transduction histidine kinase [Roseomonas pecuniae]